MAWPPGGSPAWSRSPLKSSAEVRSPATARRQALILGSMTPWRASRKRITEVWSNTCALTQPPRLQGDTTSMGTRGPMPKARPCRAAGRACRRWGRCARRGIRRPAPRWTGRPIARRRCARAGRRRHVVVEAVVLVVGDEEDAAAPDRRIAREDVQHPFPCRRAARDFGMLGVGGGRDDPRDLGQAAGGDVACQVLQRAGRQGALAQRRVTAAACAARYWRKPARDCR